MKYPTLAAAAMVAAMFVGLYGAAQAAETSEPAKLAPADYTFIGLTNLGNQFQIASGKLGATHAAGATVWDYAKLMATSHVQVENNLVALLHKLKV